MLNKYLCCLPASRLSNLKPLYDGVRLFIIFQVSINCYFHPSFCSLPQIVIGSSPFNAASNILPQFPLNARFNNVLEYCFTVLFDAFNTFLLSVVVWDQKDPMNNVFFCQVFQFFCLLWSWKVSLTCCCFVFNFQFLIEFVAGIW